MDRVLRSLLVWSFLATFLVVPFAAAPTAAFQRQPASSDSLTRVEVTLSSESLTFKESIRPEGRFITFDSALPLMGKPGEPALPVIKQMIGVPSRDIPQPTVKLATPQPLAKLTHPLEPVPALKLLQVNNSLESSEGAVGESYLPDNNLYAQNEWYPANPVSISEAMTMRGQIVVQVSFTPVQVNLVTGEIRAFASADVSLAWATESLPATIGFAEDAHHESVLASTLSNYEQARAWRKLPQTSHQAATFGGNSWMMEVEGMGLFAIPFSQLEGAGVDTSNPERLALYYGSGETAQEEALWIDNNTLYFINTRDHNRWSKSVGYRLEVLTSGERLRMAESSSTPNQSSTVTSVPYKQHFEEDQFYHSTTAVAGASNRWYWDYLNVSSLPGRDTSVFTSTFDLPHLVTSHTEPATITVELAPLEAKCHYARVLINSVQYAEQGDPCEEWDDLSSFNQPVNVPHTALELTNNKFEIEQGYISDGFDNMLFNSFTVLYQRLLIVDRDGLFFNDPELQQGTNFQISATEQAGSSFLAFEVSNLGQPQRLTDGTMNGSILQFGRSNPANEAYLVVLSNRAGQIAAITPYSDSGLRSNPAQTDYLIITHPDFTDVLESFVSHRSQDYTVRLVTTTDIYNEFGAGVTEPQAIRDFLKFAYQNWNAPAPAYALLVGDTTYDAFDIKETGRGVWVPPWLVDEDKFKGEIPADQGYVAGLDEEDGDNDPVADMYIGRLPANSEEEAEALTQKIMDYETSPPLGEWRRSVFLVADDPGSQEDPEPAGNFHTISDNSTQHFPTSGLLTVTKAYLEYDMAPLVMRDQIAEELNKGHLIIQYIGHSSISQWADERIWTGERQGESDFDLLTANRRLPLSLPWTCLDGYFIEPDKDSTSEQMLRLPDRGIIGAFAPTGLDVVSAHDILTQKFYQELFDEESPETQLGPLVSLSKQAVLGGTYERMMWTYTFLGDPAMKLNIASCAYDETLVCEYNLYLPSIIR